MSASIPYIQGSSFPYIVTSITGQGTEWGERFLYIPSTVSSVLSSESSFSLDSARKTTSVYEPSNSPTITPSVSGRFKYTSGTGSSFTATPTVPNGCGFFAWRAVIRHSGSAIVWIVGPNTSRPASAGASAWSVNASGVLTSTTYYGPSSSGYSATDWVAFARKFLVSCAHNDGTSATTTIYGVSTLPAVSRQGYILDGWYTAATGGTRVGGAGDTYTPTANTTLYAHWIIAYTISFNANGGTGAPSDVSVAEGGQWTCPSTIPTKSNSNFAGWAESQSATPQDVAYYPGASYAAPSADLILYAVWVADVGVIVYNPMGGTMQETVKTVEVGSAYGELPIPTLSGWTFTGWFTAETGGSQVTSETVMQSAGNVVIYARWAGPPMTSYVFFDANGGTAAEHALDPRTVAEGDAIGTLPTVTRSNWTFAGWKNAVTGADITASTVMGTSDIYAVAEWTRSSHTITFDPNGGTLPQDTETVYDGEAFGSLPIPHNDGSNFVGWFTEGGDKVLPSSVPEGDAELQARWSDGTVEWFKATKAVAGAGSL